MALVSMRRAAQWAPFIVALAIVACERAPDVTDLAGGPLYFDTIDAAGIPPKVAAGHRIDAEAARSREEAYVGYFGPPGRLNTLERLNGGRTEWLQRYRYDGAGRLTRRETIRGDRTAEVEHFDEAGQVARRESKSLAELAREENDGG